MRIQNAAKLGSDNKYENSKSLEREIQEQMIHAIIMHQEAVMLSMATL